MTAQITALQVADRIIRWSQEDEIPVTPLQMQKLVYLCQGWALGFGKGPLFTDAVEAWQYGPVVRSVYHALKRYSRSPIRERISQAADDLSEDEEHVIRVVWRTFREYDGMKLSRMTHASGGPWEQACRGNPRSQIIPVHVIRTYYEGLVAELLAERDSQSQGNL